MAIDFNGSTQYLSANSSLLANEPIDLFIHGNCDTLTVPGVAISLGNDGATTGYFTLLFAGNLAGDPITIEKQNDAGSQFARAASSSGYSAATWHTAWTSAISDTSRAAGIDGGSKGTNTTSVTDPTPDKISIGARVTSSVDTYFDGRLAEAYVLNTNMSDEQHAARGKGYSPLWDVPIKNVRAWYPLLRVNDLQNRMANGYPDLSATNSPTTSEHPPNVIYPMIGGLITT